MAGTSSSSSSSSCVSFGSLDDDACAVKPPAPAAANGGVKFLCSYGGKIMPRQHDGQLRYVGGDTRVVIVHRSLPFSEFHGKLRELCGWEKVSVRCQLPTEDLDALVSVTSDADLANLLEEYDAADRQQQQLKIRAFLLPPAGASASRTPRTASASPPSTPPLASNRRRPAHHSVVHASRARPPRATRCVHQMAAPARLHQMAGSHYSPSRGHAHHRLQQQLLVHGDGHWQ